jgi:hypothetical protein
MVGAGSIFTNDRYPRATDPTLTRRRDSGPGEHTLETRVEAGASVGAGCTIGCGIVVGRWALVGMGSVVTADVPAFHLVVGAPARSVAIVGRSGSPLLRFPAGHPPARAELADVDGRRLRVVDGGVEELDPPPVP